MTESTPESKAASPATERLQARAFTAVANADPSDFDRATRGRIAPASPRQITGRFGQAVWDVDAFAFLDDPDAAAAPPATVHPSLWRQGRLNNVAA